MSVRTINSITEYVGIVTGLSRGLARDGAKVHEVLLFRGMNDTSHVLLPSLGRKYSGSISVFAQERNLIESAKNRLPDIFREELSPIELLTLLQHYGIPTRLLDITENALVALYFACGTTEETGENADGEVVVFKADDLRIPSLPFVNAIADSYRLISGDPDRSLADFYRSAMYFPYFVEYRHLCETLDRRRSKARKAGDGQKAAPGTAGEDWVYEHCREPLFIRAPIRSPRQQAQQGRYILFPNRIEEDASGRRYFTTVIDPIAADGGPVAGRIVIPHALKEQVLRELELFGISESSLICDNADIICRDIRNRCEQLSPPTGTDAAKRI